MRGGGRPRPPRHPLARARHYGLTGLVPSFGPFKRGAYPLRLGVPPAPGPFGYVQTINRVLDGLRLEDAARRASTPTLLVYGARDRLVPPAQGERLAALLPPPRLLRLPPTHLTTRWRRGGPAGSG